MVLIERLSPSLDRLALEINILKDVTALAVHIGRMSVNGWFIARETRQEVASLRARISTILQETEAVELDPEDEFTGLLLKFQQIIHELVRSQDQKLRSDFWLGVRWMVRRSQRLLIDSHTDLGWIRTAIMEHDADVLPVMGEVFTSADDLIAALHRDVAA